MHLVRLDDTTDTMWKAANSSYCNLISVGILQNRHNMAFFIKVFFIS